MVGQSVIYFNDKKKNKKEILGMPKLRDLPNLRKLPEIKKL